MNKVFVRLQEDNPFIVHTMYVKENVGKSKFSVGEEEVALPTGRTLFVANVPFCWGERELQAFVHGALNTTQSQKPLRVMADSTLHTAYVVLHRPQDLLTLTSATFWRKQAPFFAATQSIETLEQSIVREATAAAIRDEEEMSSFINR